MTEQWVVLLEADGAGRAVIDPDALDRLSEHVGDCRPRILRSADRYALQLLLTAPSALDAHAAALDRWNRALSAIGAPSWPVVRTEVMTLLEFEAECRAAEKEDGETAPVPRRAPEPVADELLRAVFEDSLTGLPTAELFRARVDETLGPAQEADARHAMIMLRLHTGAARPGGRSEQLDDLIVVELAHRLTAMLRRNDIVARLGPETFAVLVGNVARRDASILAQRVLAAATRSVPESLRMLRVRASAGVALTEPGWDADRLFSAATAALVSATRDGSGHWALFRAQRTPPEGPAADTSETESCADDW